MTTVDPAQLKRTRTGHRGVATRRIGEVEAILASPVPDKIRLVQLRLGITETLDSLKQLEKDLLPHIPEDEVTNEIERNEKVKDEIFAALAKIESLLSETATTAAPALSAVIAPPRTTRLPKLTLKSFHGNLTGWGYFGMLTRQLYI